MSKARNDWFTCPVCGEQVHVDAPACPSCGADDQTGWSEDAQYDDLDLPDGYREDLPEPTKGQNITIIVALLIMGLIMLLFIGSL